MIFFALSENYAIPKVRTHSHIFLWVSAFLAVGFEALGKVAKGTIADPQGDSGDHSGLWRLRATALQRLLRQIVHPLTQVKPVYSDLSLNIE